MDRSHIDYIGTNARFINALNAALEADTNIKAESKSSVREALGRVISQKLQPFDGEKLVKAISPAARVEITLGEIGAIAAHYEIKALRATDPRARAYHHYMSHLIRHAAYTLAEFSYAEIETATQSMIHDELGENASHDEALARRLAQRLYSAQPVKALTMEKQLSLKQSFLIELAWRDAKAPLKKVSGKKTPVKESGGAEEDEVSSPLEHRPFLAKQLEMLKMFQAAFGVKSPEAKEGAEEGHDVRQVDHVKMRDFLKDYFDKTAPDRVSKKNLARAIGKAPNYFWGYMSGVNGFGLTPQNVETICQIIAEDPSRFLMGASVNQPQENAEVAAPRKDTGLVWRTPRLEEEALANAPTEEKPLDKTPDAIITEAAPPIPLQWQGEVMHEKLRGWLRRYYENATRHGVIPVSERHLSEAIGRSGTYVSQYIRGVNKFGLEAEDVRKIGVALGGVDLSRFVKKPREQDQPTDSMEEAGNARVARGR